MGKEKYIKLSQPFNFRYENNTLINTSFNKQVVTL